MCAESMEIPEIFTFDSGKQGKHLVVTGAVHGNEPCGPLAIRQLMGEIESGAIEITAGKLTVVPVCNPRAYKQNVRFTERNLNRMMFPKDVPIHYEDFLDNILCPLFDTADVLLDLHSCFSQSPPFVSLGPQDGKHPEFARILGVKHFFGGMADSLKDNNSAGDPRYGQGTTEYTRAQGGIALTLEGGSHLDANAPLACYQAIINTLHYCGLVDDDPLYIEPQLPDDAVCAKVVQAFVKEKTGSFTKTHRNFEAFKAGDLIAVYDDGEEVRAPQDGYIIMPRDHDEIGTEWFYFAVDSDYFG